MLHTTIKYLTEMALIGHKVYDKKGDRLTYKHLKAMEDRNVKIRVDRTGFNNKYQIL